MKPKYNIYGASGLTIRPGAWRNAGKKTGTPMPVRCPICKSNKIVMADYPGEKDIECEGCNSVIAYVNPTDPELLEALAESKDEWPNYDRKDELNAAIDYATEKELDGL